MKSALARRGVDPGEVDRLVALDEASRAAVGRRDDLRAQVKSISKQVGQARRSGGDSSTDADADAGADADELAARSRRVGEEERQVGAVADAAQQEVRRALLYLPNLPSEETPDGAGPEDNLVARSWPDPAPSYSEVQRVPHWTVGAELGLLDMERGAKLSGSMFPLYRGMGARMLRALTSFALDCHADAFEEIRPPTMVLTETMESTGHLPKFEEDAYHIERDDLWAIPTAEVPLTSMWRGDILEEDDLPLQLTAATACFRREAGSAGRDTRGLLRVHEFDKVELFAYATPEQGPALLESMVARAERLLIDLGLQYRVVELCTGELGISSARTFDLEVYSPGVDQWLEVSSVSWCTDYQARRANIRYRPNVGNATGRQLQQLARIAAYLYADGQGPVRSAVQALLGDAHRRGVISISVGREGKKVELTKSARSDSSPAIVGHPPEISEGDYFPDGGEVQEKVSVPSDQGRSPVAASSGVQRTASQPGPVVTSAALVPWLR